MAGQASMSLVGLLILVLVVILIIALVRAVL
jgi:hypothetical protein